MESNQSSSGNPKVQKILQSRPSNRAELAELLSDVGELLSEKLPIIMRNNSDAKTGALMGIAESLLGGLKMTLRLKGISINQDSKKSGLEWLFESILKMTSDALTKAKSETVFNIGEALIEIGERIKGAVENELERNQSKSE